MKYARVDENSIVVEIFIVPPGATINECFVPIIAEQFIQASDEVENGWILLEDGTFTSSPPTIVEESDIEDPLVEEVIEEDPPVEEPTIDG